MKQYSEGAKFYLNEDGSSLANLLNALSFIKEELGEGSFVGFYKFNGEYLELSYFQGAPACLKISPNKGAVGTSFYKKEDIYVPDVSLFPGYISCDPRAASEAVYYLEKEGKIYIFDIDSPKLDGLKEAFLDLKKAGEILLSSPLL